MIIIEKMSIDDIKSKPHQALQTITKLLDEKERELRQFKQECRRTAMQLAGRSTNKDERDIIKEADKIYKWLIDVK